MVKMNKLACVGHSYLIKLAKNVDWLSRPDGELSDKEYQALLKFINSDDNDGGMFYDNNMSNAGNLAGWGGLLGGITGAVGGGFAGLAGGAGAGVLPGSIVGGVGGGLLGSSSGYGIGTLIDKARGVKPRLHDKNILLEKDEKGKDKYSLATKGIGSHMAENALPRVIMF
jgi:hypothetical protein